MSEGTMQSVKERKSSLNRSGYFSTISGTSGILLKVLPSSYERDVMYSIEIARFSKFDNTPPGTKLLEYFTAIGRKVNAQTDLIEND
ncbi:hypothetical protein BELL_0344g00090 [Botrytis elliptica]|uniref:Uncharacterized protein n=1 Tax=Botrytis elliptica TaxID=278938 RepID=A0A4Z1JJ97_9HELO|nr:hypothetical protein BELL_0344g00090 [Botrytis elliptica]